MASSTSEARAEIAVGSKRRRRAHETGEHCRFGERKLFCALAEIALGSGIHAVHARPEIRGVEIARENLSLAQPVLDPKRKDRFLHLALQRALRREIHHAGELLGDGAASLARAA